MQRCQRRELVFEPRFGHRLQRVKLFGPELSECELGLARHINPVRTSNTTCLSHQARLVPPRLGEAPLGNPGQIEPVRQSKAQRIVGRIVREESII